jgi:DNA-binding IclR family transcriptional regulator
MLVVAQPTPDAHEGDEREGKATSVLARAAMILDAFDGTTPSLSLSVLSSRAGLPKSTVHRFAEQLLELGWLERANGGYRVGMRLFEVGGLAERRNRMRDKALPILQQLSAATHCAVHLAVLDRSEVVYLDKLPIRGLEVPTREGGRMPAHCTSLGKALLAFADDKEVERVIARGLPRRTATTITTADGLRAELAAIRKAGVSYDREEGCEGISCVAAPIRGSGRAIGAVSVANFTGQIDLRAVSGSVQRAAGGIWHELFGSRAACGTAR